MINLLKGSVGKKKYTTFPLQTGCCWEEKPMVKIKDLWDWSVDFSSLIIWLDLILLNVSLEHWRHSRTHKTNSCVYHKLLSSWIKWMIHGYVICNCVLWSNPRTDWWGLSDLDKLVRPNPMKKRTKAKGRQSRWDKVAVDRKEFWENDVERVFLSLRILFSGSTRQHISF